MCAWLNHSPHLTLGMHQIQHKFTRCISHNFVSAGNILMLMRPNWLYAPSCRLYIMATCVHTTSIYIEGFWHTNTDTHFTCTHTCYPSTHVVGVSRSGEPHPSYMGEYAMVQCTHALAVSRTLHLCQHNIPTGFNAWRCLLALHIWVHTRFVACPYEKRKRHICLCLYICARAHYQRFSIESCGPTRGRNIICYLSEQIMRHLNYTNKNVVAKKLLGTTDRLMHICILRIRVYGDDI